MRKSVLLSLLFVLLACMGNPLLAEDNAQGKDEQPGYADPPMPAFRIESKGFDGAAKADIRAVLVSTGRELWRWFPDHKLERFVVTRGKRGPIVLYKRNDKKEIVMRLDTGGLFWSQYAYQFSHEFCHILCGFEADGKQHKWFEETICETASLYAMYAMAKAWDKDPPYKHWRDYRHALKKYTDNVVASREKIKPDGLAAFFNTHRKKLEKNATDRGLNGAMAVVLLTHFQEDPRRWESVRWLNKTPNKKSLTFAGYLQGWHDASPKPHRAFIKELAGLYGITLKKPAESE